jgi:hypothetical protein
MTPWNGSLQSFSLLKFIFGERLLSSCDLNRLMQHKLKLYYHLWRILNNLHADQEARKMSNSRIILSIVTLVSVISLFTVTLQADPPKNKGKPDKANSEKAERHDFSVDANLSVTVTAGINIGDARKLASTYKLTGGKPLPPGIRKNLARGKPMPPGIQKTRMPDSFISQLPHHEGYEWQQAGTDLVLVVAGSLVISDVLEGVFD